MNLAMGFSSILGSRRSKRQANENLSIQLYNKDRGGERYKIEAGETAENVCQAIGIKLGVTPTMLNCFALKKCFKGGHYVWLSPHQQMCIQMESVDIHFRMRFIPTSWALDSSRSKSFEDFSCVRYLFWQLHWDFLHDQIDYFKREENAERARGLVVLLVLIHMRMDTELRRSNSQAQVTENLDKFLKNDCMKFSSYLPKKLKKAFLDGLVLESNMKKKVLEYQQACPGDNNCYNAIALMKSFIRNVLQNDRNIFCELHHALRVDFGTDPVSGVPNELKRKYTGREEIDIIVDLGRSPAELFISIGKEKKGVLIHSLCGIEINTDRVEVENDKVVDFCTVQLSMVDGPPEIFYFEEMTTAESFATCLETYYQLTESFYQSLCRPLQPRKIKDMNDVKAHGPITDDCLKAKLEKQYGVNPDVYTLRKSLTEHDVFEVVRPIRDKLRIVSLGKLTWSEGKYSFDGHPPTNDLKKLMHDRVSQIEGLNSTNCHKVSPKFEACDVIRELFEKHDSEKIDDEDEEEELRRIERENQPKVIMGSSIQVLSCIGKGYFTEVYQGSLRDGEKVIIKRLRESNIIDKLDRLDRNHTELFSKLKKAFNNGLNKLLELNDPKYFLGCIGVALTDPQAMLLKAEKYGNLSYFLATRNRYECQLTMHHLQTIAIQLADALGYMEEKNCFHGNLHCGNIIVTKFLRKEMLVKITDPGMVEFYNQLGLDTICNRNRIPWIAPEMYENLEAVTIRSEVYSYGMTLWQMFHEGQSPITSPVTQLMSLKSQELCQIFSQEKFPLPCPLYLTHSSDDSKEIKAIKSKMFDTIRSCCCLKEEDRLCPTEIIRKMRGNMQSYEQYYHDYNIIYESSQNFSIQGSGQTSPSSDDTSGVMMNCHPVQVPILDLLQLNSADRAEETSCKVLINSGSRDENTQPKTFINGDLHDENTTPKWSNVGPNGQSFNCPIEPGLMLKEAERSTAPCLDHPALALNRRNVTTDTEPFVSDVKFIIAEGRLTIDTNISLGSGHYGNIYKGKLEPNSSSGFNEAINVAVKALKDDQAEKFASEFKKEARIMEKLEHANIVKFYGIYRGGKYMVMELVDKGSLHQFVLSCKRRHQPVTEERQLQISIDITSGMEYLHSQRIIHCDLAARNVLLTSGYSAKVSDFGLSKILCQDKDYYRRTDNKTIPILWCAPEWIGFKKYLPESDVWSFGVVLWEIYSYGRTPLITRKDLNNFYKNLFEGKRLTKPNNCSDEMYAIMESCWKWEATSRRSFSQLKTSLQAILDRLQPDNSTPASKNSSDKSDSPRSMGNSINRTGSNNLTTNNTTNQNGESLNLDQGHRSNEGGERVSHADGGQRSKRNSDPITEETSSSDLYGKVNGTNFVDLTPVKEVSNRSSKVKVKQIGEVPTDVSKTEPPRTIDPLLNVQTIFTTDNATTFRKLPKLNNDGLFIDEGLFVDRTRPIGQGHFGKVYRGTYHGRDVAIKTCHNKEYQARFKREYELLLHIDHPNIVKLFGIHSPNGNGWDIEYVMEYCSRESLYHHLRESKHKNEPVPPRQKVRFLIDIAQGMDYLFSKSIVHADLKADNILVNEEFVAKLSDFGLAKKLESEEIDYQYRRNDGVLKIERCSPEMLEGKLNRFSDIWSYGIMCLEVFDDGEQPNFEEPVDFKEAIRTSNCSELFMKIKSGKRYCSPSECPKQLYDVIYRCWEVTPGDRVSYRVLLQAFRLYLDDLVPSL